MWPHLNPVETMIVIGLVAIWMVPDWVLKLLAMLQEIRRFRREPPRELPRRARSRR